MINSQRSSYSANSETKDESNQGRKLCCSFRSIILGLFILINAIVTISTFFTMSDFIGSFEVMNANDDDDGLLLEVLRQVEQQQQQQLQSSIIVSTATHSGSNTKWEQLEKNKRKNKMTNQGIDTKNNRVTSMDEIHNHHHDQQKQQDTSLDETNKRSLQFLHIPKNAGSTVTDSAKAANISWGYCRFQMDNSCPDLPIPNMNGFDNEGKENLKYLNYMLSQVHNLQLDDTNKYLWHYPPSIVMNILQKHHTTIGFKRIVNPYLNSDLFVVVRNPYDRIVSAYYHWETMHHDLKQTNSEGLMNRLIGESLDALEKDYYLYRGGHYIPQYDFVYDIGSDSVDVNNHQNDHNEDPRMAQTEKKKKKIVKHIIQFENFQSEFQKLMKSYDIEIDLEDHKTRKRKRNKKATLTKFNISDVNLKRIESIYLNDFKEFGFPFLNGTMI